MKTITKQAYIHYTNYVIPGSELGINDSSKKIGENIQSLWMIKSRLPKTAVYKEQYLR